MKTSSWTGIAAFVVALTTSALVAGSASAKSAAVKATPAPTATPEPVAPPPSPWTPPDGTAARAATAESRSENVTYRPAGYSFALGAGWTFPTPLGTPNTISARFRMADGLTIEPNVQVDVASGSSKISGNGASAKGSSSAINLLFGCAARKPVMSRSQVDIVGILTPFLGVATSSNKPAGGTKTDTTAFGFGAGWGLGVEYWPKTHWSISFNALNPLLAIGTTSTKDGGAGTTTSGTNIFVGADFNPTVQLLTHIYY